MSQTRETRFFDIIILVLFVFVVGWFATRSSSPTVSSLPGVSWPEQSESQLIRESQPILEGDPLPPGDDIVVVDPTESLEITPAPELEESDSGSWD